MAVTLTPFAGLDNSNVENPEALYLLDGSGTDLDGKLIRAVALVDPTTAQAMVPGSVTFTSLSIADGDDATQGATADAATASTVIGLLKNLKASLAGGGASYGACPAATTTTVKNSAGVLKALWLAGTGTAGTVALLDGSTTLFTAPVPASVGTWSLPLPPQGAAHSTSIKVTTVGTGVTALAIYIEA